MPRTSLLHYFVVAFAFAAAAAAAAENLLVQGLLNESGIAPNQSLPAVGTNASNTSSISQPAERRPSGSIHALEPNINITVIQSTPSSADKSTQLSAPLGLNNTSKLEPTKANETSQEQSTSATDSTENTITTITTTSTDAPTTVSTTSTEKSESTASAITVTSTKSTETTASAASETTKITETTTQTSTTPVGPPNSTMSTESPDQGMSSGIIALVMAIAFAIAVIIVYAGLLLWRRYLEYRYGNRELLVNDLEFDTNDLRHFEL